MEQDKPFKSIEVTDSSTGQVCKVACMSCIRGHRTTSCGIPVCRTKIFWTVKRPGRPSNSCTCRFGSSGRCTCVVAKSACPHKPKRGEKRTVDCRCDEQGRYCCLLEPEHWDGLVAMQKPLVDFYSSREALEANHATSTNSTYPPTPAHSASTPQTINSLPSTPGPPAPMHSIEGQAKEHQSPVWTTPRFGMMGVGLPLGSRGHQGQDVLVWDGHAPQAPREYNPYSNFRQQEPVETISPAQPPAASPTLYSYMAPAEQQYQPPEFNPVAQSLSEMTIPSQEPPASTFDFDKMMEDYLNYQFPSAICQNCGLNGCTCKNCPALMQNSVNGSWAQGCSRKHTRTADARATVAAAQQLQQANGTSYNASNGGQQYHMTGLQPGGDQPFSQSFNVDYLSMQGQNPMDLSEALMTDLERPTHGCCCGGDS